MEKIEITGKIIPKLEGIPGAVKLELTPQELKVQLKPTRELKVGDKVWVEAEICNAVGNDIEIVIKFKGYTQYTRVCGKDIIAHFPAEQEKELPLQTDKHENKARELLDHCRATDVVSRLLAEIDFLKKGQELERVVLADSIVPGVLSEKKGQEKEKIGIKKSEAYHDPD